MTTPHKITEVFVFLATEKDGSEGIPGVGTDIGIVPLVTANPVLVKPYRELAKQITTKTGCPIKLYRFILSEEMA